MFKKIIAASTLCFAVSTSYANDTVFAYEQSGQDYKIGFLQTLCNDGYFDSNGLDVPDINLFSLIHIPEKGLVYLPTDNTALKDKVITALNEDKDAKDIISIIEEEKAANDELYLDHAEAFTFNGMVNYYQYFDNTNTLHIPPAFGLLRTRYATFFSRGHDLTLNQLSGGFLNDRTNNLMFKLYRSANAVRTHANAGSLQCRSHANTAYDTISLHLYDTQSEAPTKFAFTGKTAGDDAVAALASQIVEKETKIRFTMHQEGLPYFAIKDNTMGDYLTAKDHMFLGKDLLLSDLKGYRFELIMRKNDISGFEHYTTLYDVTVNQSTQLSDIEIPATNAQQCLVLNFYSPDSTYLGNSSSCSQFADLLADSTFPAHYPHSL